MVDATPWHLAFFSTLPGLPSPSTLPAHFGKPHSTQTSRRGTDPEWHGKVSFFSCCLLNFAPFVQRHRRHPTSAIMPHPVAPWVTPSSDTSYSNIPPVTCWMTPLCNKPAYSAPIPRLEVRTPIAKAIWEGSMQHAFHFIRALGM